MHTGICVICGKKFDYLRGKKTTCSNECKIERRKQYNSKYRKGRKMKKSNIDDVEKEARKLGLSYGQYVALKSMKGRWRE